MLLNEYLQIKMKLHIINRSWQYSKKNKEFQKRTDIPKGSEVNIWYQNAHLNQASVINLTLLPIVNNLTLKRKFISEGRLVPNILKTAMPTVLRVRQTHRDYLI